MRRTDELAHDWWKGKGSDDPPATRAAMILLLKDISGPIRLRDPRVSSRSLCHLWLE